jgi:hypothetical protein
MPWDYWLVNCIQRVDFWVVVARLNEGFGELNRS